MALRWPQKSRASQLALIPILFTAIVCKAAQVGFDEEHPDASTQETLKEPQTFSKPRRRRRKLSLSANIMQDLGFDEGQKVMVLLVFLTIIILPQLFGIDTRPRSKYGKVLQRQEKMKKEYEAKRAKKKQK